MGRSRKHRRDVELRRAREKDAAEARQTQLAQQAAEFRRTWAIRRRRKVLAWTLMGASPVVFFTHFLEHAGVLTPFSSGVEDLTIGFPTAMLLLVTGAIVYGRD